MRLKNKVSVITGGAKGIGFAIAQKFAGEGSNIAICDIDEEGLNKAFHQLQQSGREVLIGKVDVTKFDEVQTFIQKILDKFGRIDILINNAGITRCFIIGLALAFVQLKVPFRLTSNTASQSASLILTKSPSRVMPALLISISILPNLSRTFWIKT